MYQTLEELRLEINNSRRKGAKLQLDNLIDKLLVAETLVRDFSSNPFNLLENIPLSLNQDLDKKWIDFSKESWCQLTIAQQIEYARSYQNWYAKQLGEKPSKKFEVNGIKIQMMLIPPGKFWMGSPETEENRRVDEFRHRVLISEPFWCGKYTITQAQWETIMGNNPSHFKGENLPVETLIWKDCEDFCRKTKLGLLSEAQWEYACRAGTTTAFSFGENINSEEVNYDGNYPYKNEIKGIYRAKTVESEDEKGTPIFPPNAWGLHQMHGNVWEWCQDFYGEYAKDLEQKNPTGIVSEKYRVRRGGSWSVYASFCRSSTRLEYEHSEGVDDLGFRVCRFYS